jgi:hypothetical protein
MIFEHRLAEGRLLPSWYQEKIARMFAIVEEALAPLAEGRPKKEVSQAARVIWGGVHGICILTLADRLGVAGVDSVEELTDSLIRNYLAGFTGSAG